MWMRTTHQEPVDAPPLTLEEAKRLVGIRLVGADGSLAGGIGPRVLVDAQDGRRPGS